jgi:predicted transcriptional regulator
MASNKEARPTRPFSGRIAKDAIDSLQQLADADDRSLAYMVQKSIDEFIARNGKKAKKPATAAAAPAPEGDGLEDIFSK